MTTDAVVLAEGVGRLLGVGEAIPMLMVINQTYGVDETLAPGWEMGTSLADTSEVSPSTLVGWPMTLAQTYAQAPDATFLVKLGPIVDEVLDSQDALTPGTRYAPTQTDTHWLASAIAPAWAASLSDTSQVSPVLTAAYALLALEGLGLAGPATSTMSYRTIIAQSLLQSDTLSRFFGGSLAEGVGVLDEVAVLPRFARSVAEGVGVQEALAGLLVLRVSLADTVTLDDADLVKLVFSPTLADGVEISTAYIGPDGSTTVWVVNTRTGATTEYQNYAFNSFAQMGHKYLGASSAGLYELNGDDDVGTDVVARLRSGFGQFAGSRFSGFKAAYLGIRATGDLLFRLVYADDTVTTYAVKARDMETVKINLGKGVRARYLAFELESTGQDFDLESVELVPMVAQRRV